MDWTLPPVSVDVCKGLLQKLQIVKWEREIWALLTLNCTADGRRSLTLGVKHVQLCRPSAFRAGSWHHLQRPAACEEEHDIWIIVKGLSDLERSSEMSSVAGIPAPADNELLRVSAGYVISVWALIDFDVAMNHEALIDFDVAVDIVAQGSYVYCCRVCVRTSKGTNTKHLSLHSLVIWLPTRSIKPWKRSPVIKELKWLCSIIK